MGQVLVVVESEEVAFMVVSDAVGAAAPLVALELHLPFAMVNHYVTENCLLRDLWYQIRAAIVLSQLVSEDLVVVDATYQRCLGE